MKDISNYKVQFVIALYLSLNFIIPYSLNAQNNFCEAIQITNSSTEYCQETTLSEQRTNFTYKLTCDPVNGIQNSNWFYFEISNSTDLLILTNTDSPWSLYSYTGAPCPAEINALTELECSLNGGFNDVFTAGKYYIQMDSNGDESESCAQINYNLSKSK